METNPHLSGGSPAEMIKPRAPNPEFIAMPADPTASNGPYPLISGGEAVSLQRPLDLQAPGPLPRQDWRAEREPHLPVSQALN